MTIVCRTVLDLRSPIEKYVSQTILLAASWHRHCADHSALEVLTIGPDNPALWRFLDELGIHHSSMPPGRNDAFSKSSNKAEAAYADPSGRPVLLLDNDVCFFGGIDELERLPTSAIAASEAGDLRVSDEHWELIRNQLEMPLLRRRFHPLNKLPLTAEGARPYESDGDHPERYLYLNSGVVLLPGGHDHRLLWLGHQRRIYEYFRDHPLSNVAVTSSDQAGFAASVAAHGDFAWLPMRYNYRRGSFQAGVETANGIRIVHLTGDIEGAEEKGLPDRLRAYWAQIITPQIERLPAAVAPAEKARRLGIAREVEAGALSIVRDYALDDWLEGHRGAKRRRTA
jgi:hypothetical protein